MGWRGDGRSGAGGEYVYMCIERIYESEEGYIGYTAVYTLTIDHIRSMHA